MNTYELVPMAELLCNLLGYKAALEANHEDLSSVTEIMENTLQCKYWQGAKDVIDYISPSIALLIKTKEEHFEDIFRQGWDSGDELICDLEE